MKAFLSHSSKDKHYVRQVVSELGPKFYELDEFTFDPTLNVQAIRTALSRSDLFVLFLSKNSIGSSFVSEEQRAALEARGKGILKQILIFAIDHTSYKELPAWLQEINVIQQLSSPKACARRIKAALLDIEANKYKRNEIYIGRDNDEEKLRRALSADSTEAPIAIHAVGHYGIGRRTFIQKSLEKIYPGTIETFVPLTVSRYQGAEELYRSLYALHKVSSREIIISDFEKFSKSTPEQQIDAITEIIREMADNGEFILIIDESGVYDEGGDYQPHFLKILLALKEEDKPIIGFVQTRMMPFSKRANYKFSYHAYLEELSNEHTKQLLSFSLKQIKAPFTSKQLDEAIQHLDGHPFNVHFATNFIANYGIESLILDPSELVEWKRRRAEDFLAKITFSDLQSEIIAALAEYRNIAIEMMPALLEASPELIVQTLRELEEFCCIERRSGYFHISGPLRDAVRRDKRFDRGASWKQNLASKICALLEDYKDDDQISIPVIESATLAMVKGGSAPSFLSSLILPSHLLSVARDHYDNSRRGLCMEFCKRAYDLKNRLTTEAQIEVLRLWGLSAIREGDTETTNMVIATLSQYHSYTAKRVRFFLEGFRHRLHGQLDKAEQKFLEAWKISRDNQSVNRELASLYCKQRRYSDAEIYARSAYEIAPTNPYLIDILTETLLGKSQLGLPVDQKEINRLLGELRIYGDAPGSSFYLIRNAQNSFKAGDHSAALKMINRAVDRTPNLLPPYFIRADILLAINDIRGAEDDLRKINEMLTEMSAFSEGDEARVTDLEVRILIEKGQYKAAKVKIDTSAFLPAAVANRLYKSLAKNVAFSPSGVEPAIKEWAKTYSGS